MDTTKAAAFAASVALAMTAMACGSSGADTASTRNDLVKCEGINECKGTSECKSADGKSGCQGLNDCKGNGWVSVPKDECTKKNGKVLGSTQTSSDSGAKEAATGFKCEGVNECKGHGACAGDGHECKGQNECKGKGFIEVPTEKDCLDKGGKAA